MNKENLPWKDVVWHSTPAIAYPALDLHSLQFLFMNKLSWEEGSEEENLALQNLSVARDQEGAFKALLNISEPSLAGAMRSLVVRTVFRRLPYPALDLHAFHSLFMNKLFATLTAFLMAENRRYQEASSARESQIRSGQFRR